MVGSTREKNMKRMVMLLILIVLPLSAHKQEEFLRANKLYVQGEYSTALKIYASLDDKGYGVYYNMGNAYYKKGDYLSALVQWKKAQRVARGVQLRTVVENIQRAEEKLLVLSDPFSHQMVHFFGPYVSYLPMIVMQFLWLLFMLLLLISGLRYSGHTRILRTVFCGMILASIGGTMALKRHLHFPGGALVADKSTPLFAGPNNQYHQVALIGKGNQVCICQYSDDWCKVTFGNKVGWILSSDVIVI